MKRLLIALAIAFGLVVPALVPAMGSVASAADVLKPACDNVPAGGETPTLCEDNKNQNINNNSIFGPNGIMTKAAQLLTVIVGVASIIIIISSGIQYSISSGDPARLNRAKDTLIYALIGIVIAVSAQAIIIFVLREIK